MAYITIAEIEEAVTTTRLNGFFPETGATRTAAIDAVIARASDTVDGYLSPRYTVPVPASGYVKELCLAVAMWQIHSRRGSGSEVAKKVREAYDDALKDLRDIAAGKRALGGATAPSLSADAGAGIEVSGDTTMLDSDSLAGY